MVDRLQSGDATIEDVAREAGVSRAAVSKVIRDAYGVSPAMNERVNAAIEALGYRPRTSARGMRGATFTLGIEIPELENTFFSTILRGAIGALVGTPYQLIIAPTDPSHAEGYRALDALTDRQVDGLVAISPLVEPEWLEHLASRTPIVMLGRHDDSKNYDTVVGNDRVGAGLMMDHLLGLGHQRIAHLTLNDTVTNEKSRTPHAIRLAEYAKRMRDAQLGAFIEIGRCDATEEAAYETTVTMLSRPDRPTAIFAGNDQLAINALRAVADLGLTAAEVSVSGYDDIAIASHPGISLTTISQSGGRLGELAITQLLERIAGRTEPVHSVVEPVLRTRSSTRPPQLRKSSPRIRN